MLTTVHPIPFAELRQRVWFSFLSHGFNTRFVLIALSSIVPGTATLINLLNQINLENVKHKHNVIVHLNLSILKIRPTPISFWKSRPILCRICAKSAVELLGTKGSSEQFAIVSMRKWFTTFNLSELVRLHLFLILRHIRIGKFFTKKKCN